MKASRTAESRAAAPANAAVAAGEEQLSLRSALVVLLFGAVLLLTGLGSSRVLTYHETLMAEPAREMIATGDWIIPTNVGVPVPHKPPLMHWAIALMIELFGGNEFFARLPSVAAALLVALLIADVAARSLGDYVGMLSGLVQLTSVYVLMQARLAEADMLLCATVATAIYAFALAIIGPASNTARRWMPLLFYFAAGSAFLTKGPLGLALIFPPCLVFAALKRDRFALRFFLDPPGLLIFAFLLLAWPIAAYRAYPGILKDWTVDNIGRFRGSMGQESIFLYFYTAPWLLLPWTPFTLVGAASVASKGRNSKPLWSLLELWFLVGFVILTISSFKHKHYLVPILPPLSIFAAVGLEDFVRWCQARSERHFKIEAVAIVSSCIAAGVAAGWFLDRPVGIEVAALAAILAGGLLLALWFERQQTHGRLLGAIFAVTLVIETLALAVILPHYDSYRDQAIFARRITDELLPDEPLYILGLPESQMVYYLRGPMGHLVRVDNMNRFPVRISAPVAVLAPASYRGALEQLGKVEVVDQCDRLRPRMPERDRPTLMRLVGGASAPVAESSGSRPQLQAAQPPPAQAKP